jgi:hypothetical protein
MKYLKFTLWAGRWGNNIVSLINAIIISKINNYNGILFPKHEFLLSEKIILSNENENENNEILIHELELYHAYIAKKVKVNIRELFNNYLENIIDVNRDLNLIKNPVFYVRSEDAIGNGPTLNFYCLNPLYIYMEVLKHENSELKPILVTHDLKNPVANYLYENKIADWNENNYKKDLEILLNCETLVFDCSTQIYFVILYSKKLRKLYISRNVFDACEYDTGIGHMRLNDIIGDIELIIFEIPNYPKYGDNVNHDENFFKLMLEYKP